MRLRRCSRKARGRRISRESPTPEYPRLRWGAGSLKQSRQLHINTFCPEHCHPEQSEGPMQLAATKKLHRYFAAKNAAQDDGSSLAEKASGRAISGLGPGLIRQSLLRLRRARRLAIVLSRQVMPTNSQHLHYHAGAVNQRIDAGSAAVSPGHGNLPHSEFELSRQKENLGIESPALDLLQREDRPNRRLTESFEATLRVLEFQTERGAQHQVEDPAEDLAVQRLALRLCLRPQPAGSEG